MTACGTGGQLTSAVLGWWLLHPLDTTSEPIRPVRGDGMAIHVLAALIILGLLILVMMWISSKPRSRRRR